MQEVNYTTIDEFEDEVLSLAYAREAYLEPLSVSMNSMDYSRFMLGMMDDGLCYEYDIEAEYCANVVSWIMPCGMRINIFVT